MPSSYPRKVHLRTVASLAICAALDAADFSLLPGMFVAFQEDFGASLTDIGIMYLLQCLLGALAMPVWGGLGDRMSRKVLLCIGCFAWGAFSIGCAFSTSFMEFTLFRTMAAVFMSLVAPIAQSVIADLVPSEKRGRLFGQIGFTGMLGAFVGQFVSTAVATRRPWGIRGWRLCLGVVGCVSVLWPFLLSQLMIEPKRRASEYRMMAAEGNNSIDWKSLRLVSFWLLVLQGVFGCIPWRAFGMFSILWLELIGYTAFQVAVIGGLGMIAGAVGHLVAGYIGDWSHGKIPYRGRVYVAQFTVGIGMIFIFIMFMIIPKDPNHIVIFTLNIIAFNLTATWAGNATNRPLIADIVPSWTRASVFSYFAMLESVPSSFAAYLCSFLAQYMFNFNMGGPGHKHDIASLSDEERERNVRALTYALAIMTIVPWTITFLTYSTMHWTYEADVVRNNLRLQKARESLDAEFADEDHPDVDKVALLAEGRRH
mmetsp:Transcript_919/g.1273  ORF Transcript_919/g.1273 Transcript_919/m.1273 type:complete len:483 (-) Transcript_919:244-1692(-)